MALARHRQDVIANNLANAQTTGFKRDLALYTQRPLEAMDLPGGRRFLPEHLKEMTGGGFAAATFTDFTQGPVEVSERPLDVMLQGPGMLAVQDGEKVAYTRDGKLTLLGQKLVRAVDGRPVLDVDGTRSALTGRRWISSRSTRSGACGTAACPRPNWGFSSSRTFRAWSSSGRTCSARPSLRCRLGTRRWSVGCSRPAA